MLGLRQNLSWTIRIANLILSKYKGGRNAAHTNAENSQWVESCSCSAFVKEQDQYLMLLIVVSRYFGSSMLPEWITRASLSSTISLAMLCKASAGKEIKVFLRNVMDFNSFNQKVRAKPTCLSSSFLHKCSKVCEDWSELSIYVE